MNLFPKSEGIVGNKKKRLKIDINGAVQGVGFRPFVYRLATELGLTGWIINNENGVGIEVEGQVDALNKFVEQLQTHKPERSIISSIKGEVFEPVGHNKFVIMNSVVGGEKTLAIQPDIATCKDCLSEIFDSRNRRYLYPFTNCTNCGPRFSIIESVPYDRETTTMRDFKMCPDCEKEYNDPANRRYHAQPNACPVCGPHIELWNTEGKLLKKFNDAITTAVEEILKRKIVAVKGIGGFHLITLAEDEKAVLRLRRLKHREAKPLALMFPSIESVKGGCVLSDVEENLLLSPESPIVLLKRKDDINIAPSVAPKNPYLGVMLPYTPLHHILMRLIGKPIVATSGNRSDEPICIDNKEAVERLGNIADFFLVHNRRIVRHIDDSVVAVFNGEPVVLRRSRGYAPLPAEINAQTEPVLAVGGHLKNTVAFAFGNKVFISQHIGDLETYQAYLAFKRTTIDLPQMYEKKATAIVCDLHPDYLSTKFAEDTGLPLLKVQHHYAHILSCVAENKIDYPVLGIAWDGTGYGVDGTIWGGEFLLVNRGEFRRVAYLRQFQLPGGDLAIKEPRRSGLGALYEIYGDSANPKIPTFQSFSENELKIIHKRLKDGDAFPLTSSAGRLFDAVASIIGLRQICKFEGQSAMELEFAIGDCIIDEEYPISIVENIKYEKGEPDKNKEMKFLNLMLDWRPLLESIIKDYFTGRSISEISIKFHNSLVKLMIEVAKRVGEKKIVLSGGCFQNRNLTERVKKKLSECGFNVYCHHSVPPNDGGIALGQALAFSEGLTKGK